MSRRSKTLHERVPEGYVEISPEDAEKLHIDHNEMVKVITRRGEIEIKAKIINRVKKGLIFIPFILKSAAKFNKSAVDPGKDSLNLRPCAKD